MNEFSDMIHLLPKEIESGYNFRRDCCIRKLKFSTLINWKKNFSFNFNGTNIVLTVFVVYLFVVNDSFFLPQISNLLVFTITKICQKLFLSKYLASLTFPPFLVSIWGYVNLIHNNALTSHSATIYKAAGHPRLLYLHT